MTTTDLHAIVYVSSATIAFGTEEIQELLTQARARNAREGITGVLLYSDGAFIQHIEGPETGLLSVYADILADRRHRGVIELLNEPVLVREFENWAMGYAGVSAPEMRTCSSAFRDQNGATPTIGRQLLRSFWAHRQRLA